MNFHHFDKMMIFMIFACPFDIRHMIEYYYAHHVTNINVCPIRADLVLDQQERKHTVS